MDIVVYVDEQGNVQIRLLRCTRSSELSLFAYGIRAVFPRSAPKFYFLEMRIIRLIKSLLNLNISWIKCFTVVLFNHMSCNVRKRTFWRPISENSDQHAHPRCLIRVSVVRMTKFTSLAILNAPGEYSDQTAHVRRLIWIFAGQHVRMYVFWRCAYKHTSFTSILISLDKLSHTCVDWSRTERVCCV